ncbi:RES domain-containing protein [Crateriforma spongiae]|uniref:RES domain-containing protein n=1 Tax=Crateriforma spongiae TaxID=2724528 RepID=UPI0014468242|nr:RES domain-containing protein [Crateriforma spongiae]
MALDFFINTLVGRDRYDLTRMFNELKCADLDRKSSREIGKLAQEIAQIVLLEKISYSGYLPVGRARLQENSYLFATASELSTNPNPKAVNLGRLNIREHPLFYASLDPITSVTEVARPWESGRFVGYVSILEGSFQSNKEFRVASALINQDPSKLTHPFLKQFFEWDQEHLRFLQKRFEKDLLERIVQVRNALSGLLTTDRDHRPGLFRLTGAIGHFLLSSSQPLCDALLYPAMSLNCAGVNFAVSERAIDRFFKPSHVTMYSYDFEQNSGNGLAYLMLKPLFRADVSHMNGSLSYEYVGQIPALPEVSHIAEQNSVPIRPSARWHTPVDLGPAKDSHG